LLQLRWQLYRATCRKEVAFLMLEATACMLVARGHLSAVVFDYLQWTPAAGIGAVVSAV
jgi:hypothetical protein